MTKRRENYDHGEYESSVEVGPKFKAGIGQWNSDYVPFVTHRTVEADLPRSVYRHAYELLYCSQSMADGRPPAAIGRDRQREASSTAAYIRLLQRDLRDGYSIVEDAYMRHANADIDDGRPIDRGSMFNDQSGSHRSMNEEGMSIDRPIQVDIDDCS